MAIIEFLGNTFRFGIANDEVFSGLPLWHKGLKGYKAHIIENSSWIEELDALYTKVIHTTIETAEKNTNITYFYFMMKYLK